MTGRSPSIGAVARLVVAELLGVGDRVALLAHGQAVERVVLEDAPCRRIRRIGDCRSSGWPRPRSVRCAGSRRRCGTPTR